MWKASDVGNNGGVSNRPNDMAAADVHRDGEAVGLNVVASRGSLPLKLNGVLGSKGAADESFEFVIGHVEVGKELADRFLLGKLGSLGGWTDLLAVLVGKVFVGLVEGTLVALEETCNTCVFLRPDGAKNIFIEWRDECIARGLLQLVDCSVQLSVG